MVDEKTYNVAVPPGPLGLQFKKGSCTVHAVGPKSPLRDVTKEGETLVSVNGTMVTPTTMLDVIKAADDGTSERKLAFRGRVKTTPALPAGTMSGKPTGPRFDSSTGQPIPKFDPNTGKQNWWDEEGGQQLGLPPPPQPAIMMRPGMTQPVAGINAAGQMVDADGIGIVMDGGGRVWSAPYAKIMANEVDGCYCTGGLLPLLAAKNITSEAEDMYIETGLCFPGVPCLPFSNQFRRVPNTNTFYTQGKQTTPYGAREKDHGCATQEWSRDTTGQITVIDNCPTVCCMHKC